MYEQPLLWRLFRMDLFKAIKVLYEEKRRIDEIIERLEMMSGLRQGNVFSGQNRRGRKKMGEAERAEVSRRMKEYWAKRRNLSQGKAEK
jgi:hypothetical protein